MTSVTRWKEESKRENRKIYIPSIAFYCIYWIFMNVHSHIGLFHFVRKSGHTLFQISHYQQQQTKWMEMSTSVCCKQWKIKGKIVEPINIPRPPLSLALHPTENCELPDDIYELTPLSQLKLVRQLTAILCLLYQRCVKLMSFFSRPTKSIHMRVLSSLHAHTHTHIRWVFF